MRIAVEAREDQEEKTVQEFPHHYAVTAAADAAGEVTLTSPGIPALRSAPPIEFGGPGGRWSPETMLVAAVVDCFVLTFRSIASASKFPWISLACEATGTLDRVERVTQFTAFDVRARLCIPTDGNEELAQRLLRRAETMCLVTNSLKATSHLEASVEVMAAR